MSLPSTAAEDDRFLEIGPGRGALTFRLAPRVAHVTAVEIDRDMVAALAPQVPGNVDGRRVRTSSISTSALPAARGRSALPATFPTTSASHIVLKLLDARRRGVPVSDATLMIQREVADRIAANPGTKDYGTLSIFVQLRAAVTRLLTLPPGAFRPAPKVHSAVIRSRLP